MPQEKDRQARLLEGLAPQLQPQSGTPIYSQLQQALRRAIVTGQLRPGDALPTVRALAAALRLAPNTVSRTYAALQREGLTENRAGAGGSVGAEWVRHRTPDGYTLLLGSASALATNPAALPAQTFSLAMAPAF